MCLFSSAKLDLGARNAIRTPAKHKPEAKYLCLEMVVNQIKGCRPCRSNACKGRHSLMSSCDELRVVIQALSLKTVFASATITAMSMCHLIETAHSQESSQQSKSFCGWQAGTTNKDQ